MVLLFTPKHQKLVNQCYPSGRTPDKKPKSSETSYLLYYVNSRRTKLEKVGEYLVRRSAADLSHRRIGNIMVTLELMSRIVVSCKENMNVFVKEFLDIMIKTMNNNNFNNDVSVVEGVEEVFGNICEHLDGLFYSGDSEFIQMYESFVDVYLQVVVDRLRNDELLMKGCLDISRTTNLASNVQVSGIISRGVELTLKKFQEFHPKFRGENLDMSPILSSNHEKRLSRSQTHATGLDEVKGSSNDYSEKALQSFFNTTETDKLSISIKALIKRLIEVPNKELLQYITNGIPVQLRYIVIILLTNALNQHDSNIDDCLTILRLMSGLLVSEVSIIGLSVLDFMRRIIGFQSNHSDDYDIVEACTITIASLNKKTYYRDQPLDMISDLLLKLKDDNINAFHKENLIRNLKAILDTITSSFMPLDLFLELVPFITDYSHYFSLVTDALPSGFVMNAFFRFVSKLNSVEEQEKFIVSAFQKFKYFTLLSGLLYYLTEGNSSSDESYYLYHYQAAEFLKSESYKSVTKEKQKLREPFTRTELVNYHTDPNSNKYSEKALRILISQSNGVSTTDLVSETPPMDSEMLVHVVAPGMSVNENQSTGPTTPHQRISKFTTTASNCDMSIKSLDKPRTPKVSDLKKAAKGVKSATSYNSLRAVQSVKSRVTNISFLLNELNNNVQSTAETPNGLPNYQNIDPSADMTLTKKNSLAAPIKVESAEKSHNTHHYLSPDLAIPDVEVSNPLRGKIFSS